ncbi:MULTISPECIES: sensor domain-containing diguanylate cyclase [Vibrio]|uniref:diguanylate cyclase n=1 Tax=Vibrio tasmaniensis TaxID=212663 RepID=A0AB38NLK4_9VIBR|nr:MULTISPECIES: sensor domain-containing diguanylate cyclase [Vibrio]TKG28732.1 diguanylate cyclase [Vibrio tasmaniensis]TKG39556.1 diguanylate cyclase [Vibrio tasmaniensis]TKG50434.1 diguanylate cyclase [Vibrio tasmaniensis]TKG50704.1 diguanylate cyclase [Vibrio tasmaniensis]TKG53384.1 diguanylate cyclase [Vibrio tasmaniensis]
MTASFLVVFSLLLVDSAEESEKQYGIENQGVTRSLAELTQIINALEYNITALYPLHGDAYVFSHEQKVEGDTCYFISEEQAAPRFDFMFSGPSEMCDLKSDLHLEAGRRMFIAPTMAYFANTIDTISAIYFISKDKFIISSPSDFARYIKGDTFDSVVNSRPYWVNTIRFGLAQGQDQVVYTGQYDDYLTGKKVVTLTKGIYVDGEFKGVLGVDGYVSNLVSNPVHGYKVTSARGVNKYGLLDFTYSRPLYVDGINTELYLTIEEGKSEHFLHLLELERVQLLILLALYFISALWLWRFYTKQEHKRLKNLAMLDPLTGLYNRRGFEARLLNQNEEPIIGVGVFDIDDFKVVNDQYGHKVGDEVICHVAQLMLNSVRQKDIVARFGGEEFVVAITGESSELLSSIFERIQNDISLQSYRCATGDKINISVSGGATLYSLFKFDSIGHLWENQSIRSSDEQLYKAKAAGKNQVSIHVH